MATTSTEQVTSNIPEWARPYASQLFGRVFGPIGSTGQGLFSEPYRQYQGPMVAGFNPLQQIGFSDLAGMQISPEVGQASGLAALAGQRAGSTGYTPMGQQDYYRSPLESGGYQQYMSPYMENVVSRQKSGAVQDYLRQMPSLRSSASRAGALGGSREAILESEARRNLSERLGDIEATGLQSAFQQAQAQAAQDAALRAQYGLAGTQLGEQSRQFGAGLGLQGIQNQLTAAGVLGGLGQQRYQQGIGISQAQLGAGQQLRGAEQEQLAAQYQDFLNRAQFPYRQLEFASGILRGFQPTGQTTTLYQPGGSGVASTIGMGLGLGNLFSSLGNA